MQKILSALLLMLVTTANVLAQCNEYYPITKDKVWEYDIYNGKGKLSGKQSQKVKDYQSTSDGFNAIIHSVMYNEKGKELMNGDLEYVCKNGTLLIDMRNFVSEDQMKMFNSYKVSVESENLELPSKLSVGQTLKNGMMKINAEGAPFPMKMNITIKDRKVEGKETITTPAGTFECFKITSKMDLQLQMGINNNNEISMVEWIAPKAGMIKSESYNKGKLTGSTVLAKAN